MLPVRTKPNKVIPIAKAPAQEAAFTKLHTCPLVEEAVKIRTCPVRSCMYHSVKAEHACMLEGQIGVPEAGDISEAQIRLHKGMSRETFRVEKTKGLRFIKRGIIINRLCEWMDQRPDTWFAMSTGYSNRRLLKQLDTLKRSWPWNIPTCNWTPGKILMALKQQTWEEFAAEQKINLREPHLRILKMTAEQAAELNRIFALSYRRAIDKLGAKQ